MGPALFCKRREIIVRALTLQLFEDLVVLIGNLKELIFANSTVEALCFRVD